MKLLVILKQISSKNGNLERLAESDISVIQEAMEICGAQDQVCVLGFGAENEIRSLQEAYSYGVHRVLWLKSPSIARMEPRVVVRLLADTVKNFGEVPVILFGGQADDGDSGHIAASFAQEMRRPLYPYACKITLHDGKGTVLCKGDYEDYLYVMAKECVILSVNKDSKKIYPSVMDIMKSYRGENKIEIIEVLEQSPVEEKPQIVLLEQYTMQYTEKYRREWIEGSSPREKAEKLLNIIRELQR